MIVVFNDRPADNHRLREDRVEGNGAQERVAFLFCLVLDIAGRIWIEIGLVDTDHYGYPEEVGKLGDTLHVVSAGHCRFCYNKRCACPAQGGNERAGSAWRSIDDRYLIGMSKGARLSDKRRGHGLSDPQTAVDELQAISTAELDLPQNPFSFPDRMLWTDLHAAPATVAKFLKRQNRFSDHDNGFELTDLSAFAAEVAFRFIDFRNSGGDDFCLFENRVDKQMSVGLLHIAVRKLYPSPERNSQVGGHRGLSGPAFSTGNADDHP